MKTFLCADTHLGHANVIRFNHRPWKTVEEMDAALIERWNVVVGPKDLVYHLGDFAFRNHGHYIHALNGRKVLISGTHDKMPEAHRREWTELVGSHKRPGILETSIEGQWVVLCHYPLTTWNGSCHGSWHMHGHSHGSTLEQPDYLRCDVGVDAWDYQPVPWPVLKQKMELRIEAWKERRRKLVETEGEHKQQCQALVECNRALLSWGRLNEQTIHDGSVVCAVRQDGPDAVSEEAGGEACYHQE